MQRLVDQSKKHSPKEMVKVKVDFYFFNHKLNESTNPIITNKKKKTKTIMMFERPNTFILIQCSSSRLELQYNFNIFTFITHYN